MYFYMYKTINTINNKFYIGVRQSIIDPALDSYIGSGKRLKDSIKCHGKQKFKKEILQLFNSREEMFAMEAQIVDEEFLKRDDVYNLCLGGLGGDHWSYLPNREEIIEHKRRSAIKYHAKLTKEEKTEKFGRCGDKNPMHGKTHTNDTKNKIGELNCKYTYILISPDDNQFIIKSLNRFCKENNLNRDIFMKYIGKGVIPSPRNYGKDSRINTIGWSIDHI